MKASCSPSTSSNIQFNIWPSIPLFNPVWEAGKRGLFAEHGYVFRCLPLQSDRALEDTRFRMAKMKKVAVLGGGNGAHAMAADLTLKGLEVTICEAPDFEEAFRTTLERQSIQLFNSWGEEKEVKIHKATTDFKEAVTGAEYIMMAIPATGHERFFSATIPYLGNGQTVVSWPGNYAALFFANILRRDGVTRKITLAEGHTLPWGCRLEAPARVRIFVEAWKLLLAAFPAKRTEEVVAGPERRLSGDCWRECFGYFSQ